MPADLEPCLRCGCVPPLVPSSRDKLHRARVLEPWSRGELIEHLTRLVDAIATRQGVACSPLSLALELFGGEMEAFVLFARVGHLDPPRPDGEQLIARLQQRSKDPAVDARLCDAARAWVERQQGAS